MIKQLFPLVIACLISGTAVAQVPTGFRQIPDDVEVIKNLTYARYGDRRLQLDLYRPPGPERRPAIVVITEGGSIHPGKEFNGPLAARFAQKGFIAVSFEYRAADEALLPAAVNDTKAVIRWLRANADLYNIDDKAIGAMGGSWGAYLGVYSGLTNGIPDLEGDGGSPAFSSTISALAGLSTLTDLVKIGPRMDKFLGEPYAQNPRLWEFASPITHVSKESPPLLLIASKTDDTVPYEQSIELAEAYNNLGREVELELLPDNGGHAFWYLDEEFDGMIERVADFFHRHLDAQ